MGHDVCVDLMNTLYFSIYVRLACSIWEFSQEFVWGSFFIRIVYNVYAFQLLPVKKLGFIS